MDRRDFIQISAIAAASALAMAPATSAAQPSGLLDAYRALPGRKSLQIDVDTPANPWRVADAADEPLFCGSCFKTFVLATYMQEVEAGRLSMTEQLPIDDAIRSVGGGVFDHLSGTTPARSVLEAMIAHSDNTATDAAMLRVGADKVRAFIAKAGLANVRIPDSTRRFFSYISGYDPGTDMGWAGIKVMMDGKPGKPPREAINDVTTMTCPASTFVGYYKRALKGEFFAKPETLAQFKHVLSMADAIPLAVPPDTLAYLKGGSINWNGFYCMAVAGQMIVDRTPVTFALLHNWRESEASEAAGTQAFIGAISSLLTRVHASLRQ